MKKFLLVLFCFALFLRMTNLNAQNYAFVFSQFSSVYTPLVGGADVYGTDPWNTNSVATLPIGFTFGFEGYSGDSVDLATGTIMFPPHADYMGLYSFFAYLKDTGLFFSKSPVTYSTSGTFGNRIFKVQYADAGFAQEFTSYGGVYSSVVNFQTWLYESDNSLEVHMGPSYILNPLFCYLNTLHPGPSIGITQRNISQTALIYSLALKGGPAAPIQSVYNDTIFPPTSLDSTPVNGTVYRFAPNSLGINENENIFSAVGMFPNPANENSTLVYGMKNAGDVNVLISDIAGRVISSDDFGIQGSGIYNYDLNVADFPNGIYFVTLVSGEQKITQKLSVVH